MNFAFFDERTSDEATFGGQHFTLAPLWNHLLRLRDLENTEENIRIIDDLRDWAETNMILPKEVKDALCTSKSDRRVSQRKGHQDSKIRFT
jgi:hypothetical protein